MYSHYAIISFTVYSHWLPPSQVLKLSKSTHNPQLTNRNDLQTTTLISSSRYRETNMHLPTILFISLSFMTSVVLSRPIPRQSLQPCFILMLTLTRTIQRTKLGKWRTPRSSTSTISHLNNLLTQYLAATHHVPLKPKEWITKTLAAKDSDGSGMNPLPNHSKRHSPLPESSQLSYISIGRSYVPENSKSD